MANSAFVRIISLFGFHFQKIFSLIREFQVDNHCFQHIKHFKNITSLTSSLIVAVDKSSVILIMTCVMVSLFLMAAANVFFAFVLVFLL